MTYKFCGLSPRELFEKCMDMKDAKLATKGPLGFNSCHYWNMGSSAFYILRMYDRGIDEGTQTFLGMDIRINYNNPDVLEIKEKPKPRFVVNIDTGSLIKPVNTIKKGFENMFGALRNIEIVKVIFNEPATIVIWSDGTKTVVKAQNGEIFDREKGLAMAICKKAFGNKGNYNEVFKKWVPED